MVDQRVRFSQRLSGKKGTATYSQHVGAQERHAQIKRLEATQITFFPANTISQLQPMDS